MGAGAFSREDLDAFKESIVQVVICYHTIVGVLEGVCAMLCILGKPSIIIIYTLDILSNHWVV